MKTDRRGFFGLMFAGLAAFAAGKQLPKSAEPTPSNELDALDASGVTEFTLPDDMPEPMEWRLPECYKSQFEAAWQELRDNPRLLDPDLLK